MRINHKHKHTIFVYKDIKWYSGCKIYTDYLSRLCIFFMPKMSHVLNKKGQNNDPEISIISCLIETKLFLHLVYLNIVMWWRDVGAKNSGHVMHLNKDPDMYKKQIKKMVTAHTSAKIPNEEKIPSKKKEKLSLSRKIVRPVNLTILPLSLKRNKRVSSKMGPIELTIL